MTQNMIEPIFEKVKSLLGCTLDGLNNPFDSDAKYNEAQNYFFRQMFSPCKPYSMLSGLNMSMDDGQEADLDVEESSDIMEESHSRSNENVWSGWNPSLLRTPISGPLKKRKILLDINAGGSINNTDTIHSEPSCSQVHESSAHTTDDMEHENKKQKISSTPNWTSRRRPVIKQDITEARAEIAVLAKKHSLLEEARREELHKMCINNKKLKNDLLKLQVENEKKKKDLLEKKLLNYDLN